MDERREALGAWIARVAPQNGALVPLNGDASFRRYFRIGDKIAVDSPPATQKNAEFVRIDERLLAAGLKAPRILASDLEQGFFLLEDLGTTEFAKVAVGAAMPDWYARAVDLLPPLSGLSLAELPPFDHDFVHMELGIFREWMLDKTLGITLSTAEEAELGHCFDFLSGIVADQPVVAMHRDFHCRNLMVVDDTLAILDFQDMVAGPLTYDLGSLLYDCYVNLPSGLISALLDRAYLSLDGQRLGSRAEFERVTRLTALQRHIKVLGIFERLCRRDGKSGYLKDLPRVLAYALEESALDPELYFIHELLATRVQGRI